jgi:hypothetical protein
MIDVCGPWKGRAMLSFWRLTIQVMAVTGLIASLALPAAGEGAVAIGSGLGGLPIIGSSADRPTRSEARDAAITDCLNKRGNGCVIRGYISGGCFAVARARFGQPFVAISPSLQQARANSLHECRAFAPVPTNCHLVTDRCDTSSSNTSSNHSWAEKFGQTKIPVNWSTGFTAAAIQLLWLWHIISQKMLPAPTKAAVGLGGTIMQGVLAYALSGEDGISLLEAPIFVLPFGLGELVANFSYKRPST